MGNPNAPTIRLKETVQIIDNSTGKPIGNKAVTATVGQKISLSGRASIPGKKSSSVKWTWEIDPDTVSDYVTNNNEGRPKDLSNAQKEVEQIEFYWYLGGSKQIVLTADFGGGRIMRKQVAFDVHSPKVESFVWTSETEVKVDDIYYDRGKKETGEWIHFGGYPNRQKTGHDLPVPGIEYAAEISLDSTILGGTVCFVQLVDGKFDGETFPTIPMPGMDYTHYVFRQGENKRVFKGEDSPGGRLPTDQTTLLWTLSNKFVTYLMYQPIGQKSIFIPLAKLGWSVDARAARKDARSRWFLLRKHEFPTPQMTIIQNRDFASW